MPIASLYDEPEAKSVALALCGSVLLAGLGVVPNALLRATMHFRAVAQAQVSGEVAGWWSGSLSRMPVAECGRWSPRCRNQFVSLLVVSVTSRGVSLPTSPVDRAETRRRALRYGLTVAAGSLVWAVALQGDNVTVGKALGASALGFYAFAYNYGVLPGAIVGSMVSDVALASFSHAATHEEKRALFLRFVRASVSAGAPIVALGLVLAAPGVELLLGDAGTPATHPLQVLLLVGWVRGLFPTESLLRSTGRVGVELRVGLVAAPLAVGAAIVGAQSSITVVAILVGLVLTGSGPSRSAVAARSIELSAAN